MIPYRIFYLAVLVSVFFLGACGGGWGGSGAEGGATDPSGTATLSELAAARGMTGLPKGAGMVPLSPDQDPPAWLGKALFFSRTLSANYDVVYASCHHSLLGGAHRLSLPVGAASATPWEIGPGPVVDISQDRDLNADSEAANWRALFAVAYPDRANAPGLVSYVGIQQALAAYQDSQVFVETSWKHFLETGQALGACVSLSADLGGDDVIEAGETQLRVAMAKSNFANQSPPDLHFGLGWAERVAELRVQWPVDPQALVCSDLAVNGFLVDQLDKSCL